MGPKDTLDALLADKEALTAVLLRHVVPGAALASCNVPRGTTSLDTAGGESIEVTRDRYIKIKSSAGEAGVVAFDWQPMESFILSTLSSDLKIILLNLRNNQKKK